MDFQKLQGALKATAPGNSSQPLSLTDLPPNILDALIPGYSIISRYVLAAVGVDISLFVSIAVISLALVKGGQYVYVRTANAFRYFLVSSVYIDEHDDLFDMVMDWLAKTQLSTSKRKVTAKTQRGAKADNEFETLASEVLSEDGYFDYNKWAARTPPRYEPYYGRHFLWHNGRLFIFHRSHKPRPGQNMTVQFGRNGEDDLIQIDCIGRSVEPIRHLLRTVKAWSLNRLRNTTTIRHPTPKDRARFGGAWSKTFSRPSRPMDTVILDNEQKSTIVQDMNGFLHPATPAWYATRGIPYRRGYLFHGPPGTGKTSLSFALAGIFGLEIYVISLQEPTLTEGDLMQLFNGLPRRCIVLLEDVDAAGLIRDGKSDGAAAAKKKKKDTTKAETKAEEEGGEYTLKDLARELKSLNNSGGPKQNNNNNDKARTGISLSGLLNAIDGVATHEGRVLIMTTNHAESLDAALVRPGRVDRRIVFGLAKREQARELFVRMYSGTSNFDEKKKGAPEVLARDFAAKIPEDTYTPAELQNFLMRFKDEPGEAVAGVEGWMAERVAEKEKLREEAKEEEEEEGAEE